MDIVAPQDLLFLLAEARERPMHVGGLQLFEPAPDADPTHLVDLLRDAMAHPEVHPKLARRAVRTVGGLGPWVWEEDPRLDLEYHVRHSALPYPGRVRELLTLASRLHGTLLDRNRPLWEAHLIEGLADGRFATYTKIHHALVDGVTAMKLLERALSTDPDERDMPPPWAPPKDHGQGRPEPEGRGLLNSLTGAVSGAATLGLAGGKAVVGALDAGARSLFRGFTEEAAKLPYQAPRSIFNVPITGARRFAADSYELDRVHAVRTALGATFNDVVMAMCAGGLRRYLDGLGALPDQPLVAMVPVSLRKEDDGREGNAVGVILCNLGTHVADPAARFELVRASMDHGKLQLQGLSQEAILILSAISFVPLGLGPLFRYEPLRRPPFNLVISNVPGPKQPLYWNGAKLSGMYPASIPTDGQAMNITVTSYNGMLEVGLTGDRSSVPSLQNLLHDLEDALVELEELAGVA